MGPTLLRWLQHCVGTTHTATSEQLHPEATSEQLRELVGSPHGGAPSAPSKPLSSSGMEIAHESDFQRKMLLLQKEC